MEGHTYESGGNLSACVTVCLPWPPQPNVLELRGSEVTCSRLGPYWKKVWWISVGQAIWKVG